MQTAKKVVNIKSRYSKDEQRFITETRNRALTWLATVPGRSQKDIENGTKYSRVTVNRFLKDDYDDGDSLAVARSISAFLDREAETTCLSVLAQPVEFPAYKRTVTALRKAKMKKGFAVIYGDAGMGKSYAAQQFANQDPDFNLMFMTTAAMKSLQGFLAILRARLADTKQITYSYIERMAAEVIQSLISKPRFLIINEGQRCNFDVFDYACDIQEQAGVGIAFVGHEQMYERIARQQRIDAQLYDRVFSRASITKIERGKVTSQMVEQLVRQFLPKATRGAIDLLGDEMLFPTIRDIAETAYEAQTLLRLSRKPLKSDEALIKKANSKRRPMGV